MRGAEHRDFKGRKNKRAKRNLIIMILIVAAVLGVVLFQQIMNSQFFNKNLVESGDWEPLLVNPSGDVQYFLVCGVDEGESLTDIIMVVCMDLKQNKASILQIPRDTWIGEYPGDVTDAFDKINSVYGNPREGELEINALIRKINSHFGLPIDHHVVVTLEGFRNIVDAVGGVEVDVPVTFAVDENITLYEGRQTLSGAEAEWFMRLRYIYTKGDGSRLEVQRSFYANFAKKMINMSLMEMISVANKTGRDIESDMTTKQLLSFAKKARELELDEIEVWPVPGEPFTDYEISFYTPHKQALAELLNAKFNPYGDTIFADNLKIIERANTVNDYDFINEGQSFDELTVD